MGSTLNNSRLGSLGDKIDTQVKKQAPKKVKVGKKEVKK